MFSYIWHTKGAETVPSLVSAYQVTHLSPILWIEHCVECAAPLCYKTCKIYKSRSDKRCKRFEHGVIPVNFPQNHLGAQMTFRRWAKLEATFDSRRLVGVLPDTLRRISYTINNIGYAFECVMKGIPWGKHRPGKVVESLGLEYLKKHQSWKTEMPIDGFLVTIYNHEYSDLKIIIEILSNEKPIFKRGLDLKPGWNEHFISICEIPLETGGNMRQKIFLEGNQTGTLTIMFLDYVTLFHNQEKDKEKKPAKKVKCVAWDLDNTVWKGVIGDAKDGNVTLNDNVKRLMMRLDQMGVLQTIVSKNTYEVAWQKLLEFGICDYFLYPAINWGRKSQNLLAIAKELNINIDTFALIDDSVFERQEVTSAIPQMRVYDVTEIDHLLEYPEFDIPITEESEKRRSSYQTESMRKNIMASYGDDYDRFLKDCQMKMKVFRPSSEEEKIRCLELLQRSNQYNVSREKRTEATYYQLFNDTEIDLYGIKVSDKYGDYGIVGFVSVKNEGSTHWLTDFVMSCRVAQKKVERAFLNWLIGRYREGDILEIIVYKTDRNMPLREELKKMPFQIQNDAEKVYYMYQKKQDSFVEDNIIKIED